MCLAIVHFQVESKPPITQNKNMVCLMPQSDKRETKPGLQGGSGERRVNSPFQGLMMGRPLPHPTQPYKASTNDMILWHRLMETKYQFNRHNLEQIEFSSSKALQEVLWTQRMGGGGKDSLTQEDKKRMAHNSCLFKRLFGENEWIA